MSETGGAWSMLCGAKLKSIPATNITFKSGIHTIRAFSVFFQGVRLQWQLVSDEALNLNQPVKDMGPNELKAYARLGKQQHDEANRELERRWRSYDDMLPNDQFVSIIDKTEG